MTQKAEKQKYERMIFEAFASVCQISFEISNIQQPDYPKPDIECLEIGGDTYAFELVQSTDQDLAQIMGSIEELQVDLIKAVRALPFPHNHAAIVIGLLRPISASNAKKLVTEVVNEISLHESPFTGTIHFADNTLCESLLCTLRLDKNFPDVLVGMTGFTSIDDPINDQLKKKLQGKNYQTTAQHLQLLAYYNGQNAKFEFQKKFQEKRDFVAKTLQGSQFEAVWIFDAPSKRIILRVDRGQ